MKMKQYFFIKYCYFHKLISMTRAFTLKILIASYPKDKEFNNSRAEKAGCK